MNNEQEMSKVFDGCDRSRRRTKHDASLCAAKGAEPFSRDFSRARLKGKSPGNNL